MAAQGNVFALLIGIDKYPIAPLRGCVNDSRMVESYLRTAVKSDHLQLHSLRDHQATKANIVDGFEKHLAQATENDTIFVHFAGHGSREKAAPMFWHLSADKMNEVMVTIDSIVPGIGLHNPLADKELRWLINNLAQKQPHNITVMFDCCHSGSGTRNIGDVLSRFTNPGQSNLRSIDRYVFSADRDLVEKIKQKDKFEIPSGQHVLMAACRNSQTAKELVVNGQQGGIFTHSVITTLEKYNGRLSYQDVMRIASIKVINTVQQQHPQLEAVGDATQANQLFLGGYSTQKKYYIVSKNKRGLWELNAGATAGLVKRNYEPTEFNLFNIDADLDNEEQLPIPVTQAAITQLAPSKALLNVFNAEALNTDNLKAVLKSMPIDKMPVRIDVDESHPVLWQGLFLLSAALKTAGPDRKPSMYVKEVGECDDTHYRVVVYQHENTYKYRICDVTNDRPLIDPVASDNESGFSTSSVLTIVRQLEHIAKWEQIRQLNNPVTKIKPNDVSIEVFQDKRDRQTREWSDFQLLRPENGVIAFTYYEYEEENEEGFEPSRFKSNEFRINIRNNSNKDYYVELYMINSNFSADNVLLPRTKLPANTSLPAYDDQSFVLSVPKELFELGVSEDRTGLKLMVSTEEFTPGLLHMDALDYPKANRGALETGRRKPKTSDWTTVDLIVEATRSMDTDSDQLLNRSGISISHKGKNIVKNVNFVSDTQFTQSNKASRSLDASGQGLPIIPDVLLNEPDLMHPLNLVPSSTRGGANPLNVLELNDFDETTVTEETPLSITLPASLSKHESILPIGTDGEFYYPLGFATSDADGNTKVTITQLTTTNASGGEAATRGIFKTAKIVFQKILHDKFDIVPFNYPQLAQVILDGEGGVTYDANELQIANKIDTASNVLVLIHGFTGETLSCFVKPKKKQPYTELFAQLNKVYDVIVAFDYDSYNTRIDETARAFKQKLNDVGIDGNQPAEVTILAHSMGGLVSRWMIEKENGRAMINQLVMAGTPNGGTPWPRIKDMVNFGLTTLLSNLTFGPAGGAIVTAIGYLTKFLSKTKEMDQVTELMKINSEFLNTLNTADDPSLPYTIVAGNTSIIQDVISGKDGWLKRLLRRVGVPNAHYDVLTKFLFNESNDICASVNSIGNVPATRQPMPISEEVACDHISYFSTKVGQETLLRILSNTHSSSFV